MSAIDDTPLATDAASPAEIEARTAAERLGQPFLLYRGRNGRQAILTLHRGLNRVTIGRGPSNDIALGWDTEVSRVHAELERLQGEWTLVDDGLSRKGTSLNGERVVSRKRLRDGDVVEVGTTQIVMRVPTAKKRSRSKAAVEASSGPKLTPTQRKILEALVRPYKETQFAQPASNQAIAEELFLSTDAVKAHLRSLTTAFGLDTLAISQRRTALAMRAIELGMVE
jgi:pSer/pThr/pTyr-binding forkhead associated (FHA) protein